MILESEAEKQSAINRAYGEAKAIEARAQVTEGGGAGGGGADSGEAGGGCRETDREREREGDRHRERERGGEWEREAGTEAGKWDGGGREGEEG